MPTNLPAKPSTLSDPLLRLTASLSSMTPEAVAADCALTDQARASMPALRNRAQLGAGLGGVKAVLEPYLAVFHKVERTEEEWAAFWLIHVQGLGDLPTSALAAAMRAYVATAKRSFMPSIGELRELAGETPVEAIIAYDTARKALEIVGAKPLWDGVVRPVFTPDTRSVRDAAMAAYRADRRLEPTPDRERPAIDFRAVQGRPAPGSAMTPEMIRLRAKQGGRELSFEPVDEERRTGV